MVSDEKDGWQKVAVAALACEAAAIQKNWTEFFQLCQLRSEELSAIAVEGKKPPEGLVEVIAGADSRTQDRLERRMKVVASELRKYAKFRQLKTRLG